MKARALLIAVALATVAVSPAWCGIITPVPPPPSPPPGPGPGPWIVGGTIVSALSLMICAEWECVTSNKEMSSQEAILAATIPLSCLWYRRYHTDHGPACAGPPKH